MSEAFHAPTSVAPLKHMRGRLYVRRIHPFHAPTSVAPLKLDPAEEAWQATVDPSTLPRAWLR